MRRAALPVLFAVLTTVAAACSSSEEEGAAAPAPVPEAGSPQVEGGPAPDGGKEETEIVFDKSTTFGKRACTLTLRVTDPANEVKLAGEFTDWQNGALPLTTVNYAADEISRLGVDRILTRIEDFDAWGAPQVELIEPELVVRDSA